MHRNIVSFQETAKPEHAPWRGLRLRSALFLGLSLFKLAAPLVPMVGLPALFTACQGIVELPDIYETTDEQNLDMVTGFQRGQGALGAITFADDRTMTVPVEYCDAANLAGVKINLQTYYEEYLRMHDGQMPEYIKFTFSGIEPDIIKRFRITLMDSSAAADKNIADGDPRCVFIGLDYASEIPGAWDNLATYGADFDGATVTLPLFTENTAGRRIYLPNFFTATENNYVTVKERDNTAQVSFQVDGATGDNWGALSLDTSNSGGDRDFGRGIIPAAGSQLSFGLHDLPSGAKYRVELAQADAEGKIIPGTELRYNPDMDFDRGDLIPLDRFVEPYLYSVNGAQVRAQDGASLRLNFQLRNGVNLPLVAVEDTSEARLTLDAAAFNSGYLQIKLAYADLDLAAMSENLTFGLTLQNDEREYYGAAADWKGIEIVNLETAAAAGYYELKVPLARLASGIPAGRTFELKAVSFKSAADAEYTVQSIAVSVAGAEHALPLPRTPRGERYNRLSFAFNGPAVMSDLRLSDVYFYGADGAAQAVNIWNKTADLGSEVRVVSFTAYTADGPVDDTVIATHSPFTYTLSADEDFVRVYRP